MARQDVLATLSQLTGMPPLVLDDRERVELAAIRRFFAARVIGQDEAVDVVVDRIAMLKAGLTDPGRPIAVFLFAGSDRHGQDRAGKDARGVSLRLARSADPPRHERVPDRRSRRGRSSARPISRRSQALTHRVRKQPFSVVLLDEFEKAHPNTWDLFLQVFDDGRLTDAKGQTVDFRHCIIILTSNLGSDDPAAGRPRLRVHGRSVLAGARDEGSAPELPSRVRQPAGCDHRVPAARRGT